MLMQQGVWLFYWDICITNSWHVCFLTDKQTCCSPCIELNGEFMQTLAWRADMRRISDFKHGQRINGRVHSSTSSSRHVACSASNNVHLLRVIWRDLSVVEQQSLLHNFGKVNWKQTVLCCRFEEACIYLTCFPEAPRLCEHCMTSRYY